MGPRKKKNLPQEERIIDFGHPETNPPFADNSVKTSKYTLLSFLPYVSFVLYCMLYEYVVDIDCGVLLRCAECMNLYLLCGCCG